ncbi:MAG: ribosome biogenesis GTP-binding protein YihA/YsxC [Prolixibacteraceae bacterium]|jgi:GTP-binding protein|nr:ribosome biogenesis GTP-binding protein YihA/YsxC [Prolixibacteraceae bacterium]
MIKKAEFIISNTDVRKCPSPDRPEYAFIGRSNVGKSSLINMLTGQKKLAKISEKPGKTQLINHFSIDDSWYLVDLPGYGYAKVSKTAKYKFQKLISDYVLKRENLYCLFVLVDSRHELQKIDSEFMMWLGENAIPFAIIFTKADKLGKTSLDKNINAYKRQLLEIWTELPTSFISSAENGAGKEEILDFIDSVNNQVEN